MLVKLHNDEEWKPVVGWEGLYEVSSHGRVRSLDRVVNSRGGFTRTVRGAALHPYIDLDGYPCVTLSITEAGSRTKKNYKVSRLVGEAHLPQCRTESRYNVLHWDDDKTNNHRGNLRWGSRRDNSQDIIRNGNNPKLNRTQCKRGHDYTENNTYLRPSGSRECRECMRTVRRGRRD